MWSRRHLAVASPAQVAYYVGDAGGVMVTLQRPIEWLLCVPWQTILFTMDEEILDSMAQYDQTYDGDMEDEEELLRSCYFERPSTADLDEQGVSENNTAHCSQPSAAVCHYTFTHSHSHVSFHCFQRRGDRPFTSARQNTNKTKLQHEIIQEAQGWCCFLLGFTTVFLATKSLALSSSL